MKKKQFEMIGLGKHAMVSSNGVRGKRRATRKTVRGKGVQKVRDFKPATKLISFIEENKAVRDMIPAKILNQGMKVLQTGKKYGFGKKNIMKKRTMKRGKGFLGDIYNFGKKAVGKLKDLGIARKLKQIADSDIVDYGLTGLSAVAPEIGVPLMAGKKAIQKSGVLDKAAKFGFGKSRIIRIR